MRRETMGLKRRQNETARPEGLLGNPQGVSQSSRVRPPCLTFTNGMKTAPGEVSEGRLT